MSPTVAESEINQEQSMSRQALLAGTCHPTLRHQTSRKRRRLNSPSPSPGGAPNPISNLEIRIQQMGSDVMNAARQFGELERCNAALTKDNADMNANAPEGWIAPAEVSKQFEQQAEKHAAQIEALKTEHTSRIKSLEAQVKELGVRLG